MWIGPTTDRFFTDMWGGSTSDADVRMLIHGYDLVQWNSEDGAYEPDPSVVSGFAVTEDDAGDRTYTLVLYDDLVYSDGNPITARDYAFSMLLQLSGEVTRLGGSTRNGEYLLGCEEYVRKTLPLQNTELLRIDADGNAVESAQAGESTLVERVLRVLAPVQDGTPVLTDFADLAADADVKLIVNADGTLALPEAASEEDMEITVSPAGIIRDWHYENGARVYAQGGHPRMAGIRVTAEDTLQITVNHEYLPFFYELGLLAFEPYPISVIAPGAALLDDGDGAYIANAEPTDAASDNDIPAFSVETLNRTLFDEETGYASHPTVGSGPYIMKEYDGTTAEFEMNPLYKGDALGRKPTVKAVTFTLAENATLVEKLATGGFDLVNKVTETGALKDGMNLLRGEFTRTAATLPELDPEAEGELWASEDKYQMSNYPRAGVSYIAFHCDRPIVNSEAVRQAIAWCADRDAIARDYTGGSGMKVDSYYGMGQWMASFVTGTLEPPVAEPEDPEDPEQLAAYEAEVAEWEKLNLDALTEYGVDLEKARALLSDDGWKLNEEEGVLEKDGEPLDLVLAYQAGNAIGESLQAHMLKNLEEIGVRVTLVELPGNELMMRYHRDIEGPVELPDGTTHEIDMFYLASNFDVIFDPAPLFALDAKGVCDNDLGITDAGLFELALDMNKTESDDLLGYMKKWIAFEERFNQTLPMLPIYTNVYFDFYPLELHNYNIDETVTWGQAILDSWIGEQPEQEPEATTSPAPGEAEGDEEEFETFN